MRWKDRKYEEAGVWYIERKRFLFWPMTINDETRWLERAEWRELWRETSSVDMVLWQTEKWIN